MKAPQLLLENTHPTLGVDEEVLARLVAYVLQAEQCTWHYVGVILSDHATVLELNRTYLGHNYLTDVLSFALHIAGEAVEGEVYVDLDTAYERHEEFNTSFDDEVRRYAIHGLLHLIGYDDATPEEKAAMRIREDRYLLAVS